MSLTVIEGTWEEIKRHEAELMGRRLRLIIEPEPHAAEIRRQLREKPVAAKPKVLRAMGAFKGMTGGSEEFAQEKRAEIEREESRF